MKIYVQEGYLFWLQLRSRLIKRWKRLLGDDVLLDMSSLIPFYKNIWREACTKIAADFSEITDGIWKVSRNERMTLIHNYKVQIDDPVVLNIAGNKALCYRLLSEHDMPVPPYETFTIHSIGKAKEFMEKHKGSLFVVKPSQGTSGARGITTHVRSLRECTHAAALASLYGKEILIERLIPGESYRLLILDGRMIHAVRRRGMHVTGNGFSTVCQLVEEENRLRQKQNLPCIDIDRDLEATLKVQGFSGQSILGEGQTILVKSYPSRQQKTSEYRTVFNEDVSESVCRGLQDEAVRAASIIQSRFAGVDIITLDLTVPLGESGGVINEINTTPGLHHHFNLTNGTGCLPAADVLNYLLRRNQRSG